MISSPAAACNIINPFPTRLSLPVPSAPDSLPVPICVNDRSDSLVPSTRLARRFTLYTRFYHAISPRVLNPRLRLLSLARSPLCPDPSIDTNLIRKPPIRYCPTRPHLLPRQVSLTVCLPASHLRPTCYSYLDLDITPTPPQTWASDPPTAMSSSKAGPYGRR